MRVVAGLRTVPLLPAVVLLLDKPIWNSPVPFFGQASNEEPLMISLHIQRMREKLRAGKIVLGAGITLSDPTVTEAIAPSVDFVWIDMEHNALTIEAMLGHLIAAR